MSGIRITGNPFSKLENVVNSVAVKQATLNQMESDMQRFVPYRQGNLTHDVFIDAQNSQIIYKVPYAKAQFYGMVGVGHYPVKNYTTATHQQAGKRWDLRGKATFGNDWAKVAGNTIAKEMK